MWVQTGRGPQLTLSSFQAILARVSRATMTTSPSLSESLIWCSSASTCMQQLVRACLQAHALACDWERHHTQCVLGPPSTDDKDLFNNLLVDWLWGPQRCLAL